MAYVQTGLMGAPWSGAVLGRPALPPPGGIGILVLGIRTEDPALGIIFMKVPGVSPGSRGWIWASDHLFTFENASREAQRGGFSLFVTNVEEVHRRARAKGKDPMGGDVWEIMDDILREATTPAPSPTPTPGRFPWGLALGIAGGALLLAAVLKRR